MSYDKYRDWLRGMKDSDLNKELEKLQVNATAPNHTERSKEAWGRMLEIARRVQQERDNQDMVHLQTEGSGVDAD
jgi:hypothetical protein